MKSQPEGLRRSVGVEPEGALVENALVEIGPAGDQRDDHPGSNERSAGKDNRRAPHTRQQTAPDDDHEHADREQREVPGEKVHRDRQTDDERRECVPASAGALDRPPAEAPRKRQEEHAPLLRPEAVAEPRVAEELVAVSGDAHQQRRDQCRGRRCPRRPAQQTATGIDAHGKEREEEIPCPPLRGVGPEDERYVCGDQVRKALVVRELRVAKAEIRKPPVELQHVALVNLLHRPAHHLEMHGLVVERLDDRQLARHGQETEDTRNDDEQPRCTTPPPRPLLSLGDCSCLRRPQAYDARSRRRDQRDFVTVSMALVSTRSEMARERGREMPAMRRARPPSPSPTEPRRHCPETAG